MKKTDRFSAAGVAAAIILGASLIGNAVFYARSTVLERELQMQRQREITDIADAMSDIEINLQKLLIACGAAQSVELLSRTALLAQQVENGLSRLPLEINTAANAMKFTGQMGDYAIALAAQVSGGSMLSGDDEQRLRQLLEACRSLNEYLASNGRMIYSADVRMQDVLPGEAQETVYPTLIYDGPFSDGKGGTPKGLTGERITREEARQIAARAAGTTADRTQDAWDSGGAFEAFGFTAQTPQGNINVQITGQGGHVLWMMPEKAEFSAKKDRETCLDAAKIWLADVGFGQMEPCFVQEYDGMIVANFASLQDGVLIYPDQVKVQVSMESGTVVGAECSQYLTNHAERKDLVPKVERETAREMVSDRLEILSERLCLIPGHEREQLCWGFEGAYQDAVYWVFVDARTGKTADLLRVIDTPQGETAL
ncbi:MAG: germination protein YpeB [Clostridia bacterium]|nr:germination protein YpeB [Clostridia bacterium]